MTGAPIRDSLYKQVTEEFGAALERLARAYEADPDKRLDLLQEIHLALWRSLEGYQAQCSLRTWVYRVAHNTASTHVGRQSRTSRNLVGLEEVEATVDGNLASAEVDEQQVLDRVLVLIHRLKPLDRQIMLSYLEGLDAASIGEITGISAGNVATKIHRIKNVLARRFGEGGSHE